MQKTHLFSTLMNNAKELHAVSDI